MLNILIGWENFSQFHFYLGFNSRNNITRIIKLSEKALGVFWLSTACQDFSNAHCPMDLCHWH